MAKRAKEEIGRYLVPMEVQFSCMPQHCLTCLPAALNEFMTIVFEYLLCNPQTSQCQSHEMPLYNVEFYNGQCHDTKMYVRTRDFHK